MTESFTGSDFPFVSRPFFIPLLLLRSSMALLHLVNPMLSMKAVVVKRSSKFPCSCSCSVDP